MPGKAELLAAMKELDAEKLAEVATDLLLVVSRLGSKAHQAVYQGVGLSPEALGAAMVKTLLACRLPGPAKAAIVNFLKLREPDFRDTRDAETLVAAQSRYPDYRLPADPLGLAKDLGWLADGVSETLALKRLSKAMYVATSLGIFWDDGQG